MKVKHSHRTNVEDTGGKNKDEVMVIRQEGKTHTQSD